ncbi:hypothetical protein [Arthrobacter sp. Br18]|uniref:hypothetical protein n=1 Tax=Arthrobacter sp. Br18 TaxID=1312954 RepID=UPI0004B260D2|nr:hypothetical protein [Arthrobacter sp. Br18]
MKLTVTVKETHRSTINDVAEQLRSCGMDVDRVMSVLGMITGSAPQASRSALEAVDGVAAVDEELPFRLPPPESGIQ